jgi:hypothetical protein
MRVNYFFVATDKTNPITIETVHGAFGDNIPNYIECPQENNKLVYLCCVDARIDVSEICKKYNYTCGKMYLSEIDDYTYSSNFTIHPSVLRNRHYSI